MKWFYLNCGSEFRTRPAPASRAWPVPRLKSARLCILALLLLAAPAAGQTPPPEGKRPPPPIWIMLKTGERIRGDLTKMDGDGIEFIVRGILQTLRLDEVETVSFSEKLPCQPAAAPESSKPAAAQAPGSTVPPPAAPGRLAEGSYMPRLLGGPRASYTREAVKNYIQGEVILRANFPVDGKVKVIRVLQGLPYGLTDKAIQAAEQIKFEPARKNDVPISVEANVSYTFTLK